MTEFRKQLRRAKLIANLITLGCIILAFGMAVLKWIY